MATCFDCGKEGKTHRHHLQYDPPIIVPLCPSCHRRRHSQTTVPWTEVLTDEQRNTLIQLMDTKDKKIEDIKEKCLSKAQAEIDRLSEPIETKFQNEKDAKMKSWGLSNLPEEFELATYPKPIYTLRYYMRLDPNKKVGTR